eukprot:CAMPEP_0116833588 /NCGR_PEP_ID=MMETSP0418-20121206/6519_1 /TAXON_ID=1158023 /ORGANISM="Astrosyne radiata, Strain 13vi08-1A" /LENGTH=118 /DNA_ID=CAMNT_0004463053 /DNA_START=137 /DNA_END=489 /DNA_ORIENTATION=+
MSQAAKPRPPVAVMNPPTHVPRDNSLAAPPCFLGNVQSNRSSAAPKQKKKNDPSPLSPCSKLEKEWEERKKKRLEGKNARQQSSPQQRRLLRPILTDTTKQQSSSPVAVTRKSIPKQA